MPDWVTIPLFTMVLISLAGLVVWIYVTRSVGTMTTPDVTGRNIEQVDGYLSDRGIPYRIIEKSSLQSPEGEIIRQVPPAGTRIKENRPIDLYVSQGPEYLLVPGLTGNSLLETRNQLMRNTGGDGSDGSGFNLGNIARVYSDQYAEGHVISQQPEEGEEAVQGSEIDLLVSKGQWPRRTEIPRVEGDSLTVARRTLEGNHLKAGNIRYTYRADSSPSVVLDQFPPSGRLVNRGQSISLTVNLSEPETDSRKLSYTSIRINPPLDVVSRPMKVVMNDQRGSRVVFQREVDPGKQVKFLASIKGKAELMIYWDGEFYRYRTLEVTP